MGGTKKPWLAFLLSFILPGAGLWYLGKWAWGFANLGAVLTIGLLCALGMSDELFEKVVRYVAVGCSGGSAALAQSMATLHNAKHARKAASASEK